MQRFQSGDLIFHLFDDQFARGYVGT